MTVALLGCPAAEAQEQKSILCYFGSWSTYRWASGHFDVEDIDPFLCTHLVFGFAGLDKNTYTIKVLDEYNELDDNWGKGAFRRFTNLKLINPNLKTLLAIGGWNEGLQEKSIKKARKQFIYIFQGQLNTLKWCLIRQRGKLLSKVRSN